LEQTAIAMSRERVRRARLGLDLLQRYYPEAAGSRLPAPGLAVPLAGVTAGGPAGSEGA
jgi:hypothetical protein